MMSIKNLAKVLLISSTLFTSGAFGFSGYLYIEIKGVVLSKPCQINNGQAIEVNFGDVMTTRIEGEVYKQPMEYTITCQDGVQPKLNMYIDGTPAAFDQGVLKTSVDNLGVLFKADATDFPLKSKRSFNFASPAKLFAVLVKKSGADLPAKAFTANATLKVEYQ